MIEMNQKLSSYLAVTASLLGLLGCTDSDGNSADRSTVVNTYAENLAAAYADSVADETDHQAVVGKFLADPTEKNLAAARTSWLEARAHYMLTEGARFYDGPIDVDTKQRPSREGLINSWPLDEAYIDYTTDAKGVVDETVGIVNDPTLLKDITASGLDDLNAVQSDTSISSGYHAVEFLLWGQALKPTGPGERPASDYDLTGTRPNPDRRAQYLKVAIDGIITHLTEVRDAWATDAEYRVSFEGDANAALTKIFTGLAKFSKGELGSQRIGAAYMSKERHDQHDCFSSDTLVDYERDARGIQNMYLGKYGDNDGLGLNDLVHAVDPAEDTKLQGLIQDSIDAIVAIPTPFEASIAGADDSPGRLAISKALDALSRQGDEFGVAAAALGYKITVDDPPADQ
ncbi:MAG: imelysin family protein [Polyangiaceae bacterium]